MQKMGDENVTCINDVEVSNAEQNIRNLKTGIE